MAGFGRRQTGTSGAPFDLFPFLGILACVLGSLLLIVLSVAAVSTAVPHTVLVPEGTSTKTPVIIEWDGMAVTIHPEKVSVSAGAALANDGKNQSAFGDLLTRVASLKEKSYIFVMVRPSGFANFGKLRSAVVDRKIDIGYEPIEQHSPLSVAQER